MMATGTYGGDVRQQPPPSQPSQQPPQQYSNNYGNGVQQAQQHVCIVAPMRRWASPLPIPAVSVRESPPLLCNQVVRAMVWLGGGGEHGELLSFATVD